MNQVFNYKSFRVDFIKDLQKHDLKQRTKAANHLIKTIKQKINKTGEPSNEGQPPHKQRGKLRSGIRYQHVDNETRVGAGPPAYHAHLLEFGTRERTRRAGGKTGLVAPRPFLFPTFEEEADTIQDILSEPMK